MNIFLIIGYPLKSSLSPAMHNAGFKKLGIDGQYSYTSAEVKPQDLKKAIAGVRALGIKGVSVTMPYKQKVMQYLDKIDVDASKIGAVNTIVNNNGELKGANTDWLGAIDALQQKSAIKGKKVAVIGAGGAASAIIYGLIKEGAIVKIFNRSQHTAKILAEKFGCTFASLDQLKEITKMDIAINTTPLGMTENISPVKKQFLRSNQIVFDIVYSPKETKLIKYAQSKGAKIVYGDEMLLHQGLHQFKLFTGVDAPIDSMRKALKKALS